MVSIIPLKMYHFSPMLKCPDYTVETTIDNLSKPVSSRKTIAENIVNKLIFRNYI